MIQIVKVDDSLIKKAETLVSNVFLSRNLKERLSFWAFKHQHHWIVKKIMHLSGVYSISNFWVALDDHKTVVGTTGLYTCVKDKHEAIWLAWLCVDPKRRGEGIGKQLIEYSIKIAKNHGKKYFRLYTSSSPDRKAAQELYEAYGFKVIKRKKRLRHTRIFRELVL